MMILAGFGCGPNKLMEIEKTGRQLAPVSAKSAAKTVAKPTSVPSPTTATEIFTSGDYGYILLEDGTVQITGFRRDASDQAFTNALDGHPVTRIGDSAFYRCSNLTGITIPNSVTTIGDGAFAWCESLIVTVGRDSYATQYCKDNGIPYTFTDSLDWLNH